MFQNISREVEDENLQEEDVKIALVDKVKIIIKKGMTKQSIILYIISLMVSMVGFGGNNSLGLAPFALAILAAVLSNNIAIIGVFICTLIGTGIGFGPSGLLNYILTSLVFLATVFIFRHKYQEDVNEQRKLGLNVLISSLLVQVVPLLFSTFYLYDFLIGIMLSITTFIFYKIFVNSITVVKDFGVKKAFSIEEVIGASLLIAIAVSALEPVHILGFSVKNILSILIVLILGWKNGILVGATGGITIGAVLGIIGSGDPIMVAAFAISGMIAGIFNKFGKIGVIVGFIIGNCLLTYVSNGNIIPVILYQEILFASLGLLLLPKKVEVVIEDLFGKSKLLPETTGRTLEENRETIHKLTNISDTISEMAKSYAEVAATIVDDKELEKQEIKNEKIFISELRNNLDGLEENILYEDMYDSEEIVLDIFKYLLKNDVISKKSLLKIFENHNNYIIGFDSEDDNQVAEKDLAKMIKVINYSYKVSKINFIWEKKIEENKKNVSNQLQGVSEVIASLAENIKINKQEEFASEKSQIMLLLSQKEIEIRDLKIKKEKNGRIFATVYTNVCENLDGTECEIKKIGQIISKILKERMVIQNQTCGLRLNEDTCSFTYISNDKYNFQVGIAKSTKADSPVSGDTSIQTKLADGKYLLALSDGMGSGPEARKSSKIAIKMLERLLTSGFDKEVSINLINSTLAANYEDDMYATLDIQILDLYKGNVEFIKNGACPSFIKRGKEVQLLKNNSLPTGMIGDIDLVVYDKDIKSGDILVMCSDGVIESNSEYVNKELWIKYLLEDIQTEDVQQIADLIISEAIDNDYGKEKDDMTVIVAKVSN